MTRQDIVNMRVCFSASEAALITALPNPGVSVLSMSGYSYMLNITNLISYHLLVLEKVFEHKVEENSTASHVCMCG